MKFSLVLMVVALLALQSALRINFVTTAQQSGNNATLDAKYPSRVMNAPSQLCPRELNREGVRIQVKEDIHSILRNKVLPELKLEHKLTASCSELFLKGWNSGYYWVSANGTSPLEVYCDMNRHCCNSPGGWTLVAYLNMTNPTWQCPDGWRELTAPIRTCRRANGSYINSVVFDSNGMLYNSVCGRIIGYQFGTPEAFLFYNNNQSNYTLEANYVDGVSVTYGQQGHRKHIWTFVGARGESYQPTYVCPCTNTGNIRIPPWVGTDYFCESGTVTAQEGIFYQQDPLWDGQGCGSTSTCCNYGTISHHGFASSCQKKPVRILRFG